MRITVTGATGHVGATLVRDLLVRGQEVRALVYEDSPALVGLDVESVWGNVLSPDSLRQAFAGADQVYHLAASIFLGRDAGGVGRRVNVEGTANVVEACLACGVSRLIHFSSIHALSAHPRTSPVTEARPLCLGERVPGYDRSKAEAEAKVWEGISKGLDAVILCPTGVVGPYDFAVSHMARVLLDLMGRRVPALVHGGFDWVDVRDVTASAMAAAEKGRRGERYILAGHYVTLAGVALAVQEATGVPAPKWVLPMNVARLGATGAVVWEALSGKKTAFTIAALHALRNHQEVDGAKAARELGHHARPFSTTIADTFDWFREAGMLPT
jgi:dihydroflavonol-4-reductase